MSIKDERTNFNTEVAPQLSTKASALQLAREVGFNTGKGKYSTRFSYFGDETRFVVVAGLQEGRDVDLAFAYGLTYRGQRKLILVLPKEQAFATLQRAPWFKLEAQPEVWLHDGFETELEILKSPDDTIKALSERLNPKQTLAQELSEAATPAHLGDQSEAVEILVEWATKNPLLDGSHRPGYRAWQCMGQKVLSIELSNSELIITAGIHWTKSNKAPKPKKIPLGSALKEDDLEFIKKRVQGGIDARLSGTKPIGRRDEHWLQAVIRGDPSIVGVEQPALRELPAWRPSGASGEWGRGFIDLLGVDGHGDIRIVETKTDNNKDDLLILQGLDYYIWAKAYSKVLCKRLGASEQAKLEIHYVIGATSTARSRLSRFAEAEVRNLIDSGPDKVRWRFQIVSKWDFKPGSPGHCCSELLEPSKLP
jgi:hypothetical protein